MAKIKQSDRNKQIFADRVRGDSIKAVAARYKVHPSRVSQIVKEEMQARSNVNQSLLSMSNNNAMFPTSTPYFSPAPPALSRQDLMNELGTTGLWRFGGTVREEFLRELQARKGIQLYREMRDNHPVVGAVFFAIEMALRQVRWFVQSASDDSGDRAAADFLEGALDDMSFTWQDTLAQILTMLQYGFSLFELVYKVRKGQFVKGDYPESKYDDGRIGWRKWLPLAQDTLAPGREWIWDENGGVQGINQLAPPDWILRTLPIEKLLLFRTTVAKNNPEGRPILRNAYLPWYYAKNLSEVEAIALERWGTGVPVMYMGSDTNKAAGTGTSDLDLAKQIVRDVRADEQSGVVIPYAKMGSGAKDGEGMLFELVSPPSRGIVDFDATIMRYNKQIALSCLAQFIMLGLAEGRGSYALSKDHSDMFIMALGTWAEMIVQVINRFAVRRLFELNNFDLTDLPQLTHSEIAVPDLAELGTYINQLAGAGLIVPDDNLEADLREKAHLPPKPDTTQIQVGRSFTEETPDQTEAQQTEPQKPEAPNAATQVKEQASYRREVGKRTTSAERFQIQTRRAYGGAKYETAVNEYQKKLENIYAAWYGGLSKKLEAESDPGKRGVILLAALAVLENDMKAAGRNGILGAMQLGAGDTPLSPDALSQLAQAVSENDAYIEGSLIPAIRNKAEQGIRDDMLVAGGAVAIAGIFSTFLGRVASYAGAAWTALFQGVGDALKQEDNWADRRVEVRLDPGAEHCEDCVAKAGTYDNWDQMLVQSGIPATPGRARCSANCRCTVYVETLPGSGEFVRF